MRDPSERLKDVLEAIAAIERHMPVDEVAFAENELLQGGFVRNIQIVGEALRAVPPEVRSLAPDIKWSKIIGMRNVLVHGYFDIDTAIVWATAKSDIAGLQVSVQKLLQVLASDAQDGD